MYDLERMCELLNKPAEEVMIVTGQHKRCFGVARDCMMPVVPFSYAKVFEHPGQEVDEGCNELFRKQCLHLGVLAE